MNIWDKLKSTISKILFYISKAMQYISKVLSSVSEVLTMSINSLLKPNDLVNEVYRDIRDKVNKSLDKKQKHMSKLERKKILIEHFKFSYGLSDLKLLYDDFEENVHHRNWIANFTPLILIGVITVGYSNALNDDLNPLIILSTWFLVLISSIFFHERSKITLRYKNAIKRGIEEKEMEK